MLTLRGKDSRGSLLSGNEARAESGGSAAATYKAVSKAVSRACCRGDRPFTCAMSFPQATSTGRWRRSARREPNGGGLSMQRNLLRQRRQCIHIFPTALTLLRQVSTLHESPL